MSKYPTIIFFDAPHSYWHNEVEVPSVGSYISSVDPRFDGSYWLVHNVFKKYFGKDYESVYKKSPGLKPDIFSKFFEEIGDDFFSLAKEEKNRWTWSNHSSSWRGTMFHKNQEDKAYELGYVVNPFSETNSDVIYIEKEYDNQSITDNFFDLVDGCYLELLVYHLGLNVAGQADQVFIETIDGVRYIDINDFKSNLKQPNKSSPDRLAEPLNHLYASKHTKYNLQLSLYGYILAQYGFTVRKLAYTWYKDYDESTAKRIDVPYLEKEAEMLLNFKV